MSARDDGGPAFPRTGTTTAGLIVDPQQGMSLRDYFAAAALPKVWEQVFETVDKPADMLTRASALAYGVADAMIAERNRP